MQGVRSEIVFIRCESNSVYENLEFATKKTNETNKNQVNKEWQVVILMQSSAGTVKILLKIIQTDDQKSFALTVKREFAILHRKFTETAFAN